MKRKTANINIRVEPQLIEKIDAWRAQQRVLPSRGVPMGTTSMLRGLQLREDPTLRYSLAVAFLLFSCVACVSTEDLYQRDVAACRSLAPQVDRSLMSEEAFYRGMRAAFDCEQRALAAAIRRDDATAAGLFGLGQVGEEMRQTGADFPLFHNNPSVFTPPAPPPQVDWHLYQPDYGPKPFNPPAEYHVLFPQLFGPPGAPSTP
jgi:hypothetical protein